MSTRSLKCKGRYVVFLRKAYLGRTKTMPGDEGNFWSLFSTQQCFDYPEDAEEWVEDTRDKEGFDWRVVDVRTQFIVRQWYATGYPLVNIRA